MKERLRYFFAGFGSVLSFMSAPPSFGRPAILDDKAALENDWQAVGDDLRWAFESYGQEENAKQRRSGVACG